ncbi:MarR family winged helix-turn-helix transcriptional regulator [Ktedonobacter racemifer]|uniref:Transcriptional regulator, MarR family n=1 Tax=Ktedonobacter racemifer DSM 44963 TaxID=485913 RepID=D6TS56_KTERA|nr:MarR family transcriptional regulator [Ktedonobacter racemifer]EFH86129.1 transcriptional regulator, MarR family [Ktedonobacter racemifer DSM 44963]
MDRENDSVEAVEHAITILSRTLESAQKERTLTLSAYLLLGEIVQNGGPLGINVLAQALQLDISTISRQVAALESSGLAERFPDPVDARVSLLQITDLGQARFQEAHKMRYSLFSELFENWPEEDRRQFGIYLERFNQAIRQRRNRQTHASRDGIGPV